jgi:flavin reductase (DIM6/NTAB) family NADH-FMN oxidoreductase RutF
MSGADLIIDPKQLSPRDMYRFMIDAVVPRPIAFVSSVGPGGRFNVAPFSYFNAISSDPPLLAISINLRRTRPKDTLRNIQDTGDFVENIVPATIIEKMVQASGDWPEENDEFELTGLTPAPSELVRAPRVAECPVSFECRVHRMIEFGSTTLVIGEVARARAEARVLVDGRVDATLLEPVGRLGGDGYAIVREVIHMARPRVAPPAAGKGTS